MADTNEYAATFEIVDANGDGLISAAELMALMRALGDEIPAERATDAVQKFDQDGDGLISLDEFADFMSGRRADGE